MRFLNMVPVVVVTFCLSLVAFLELSPILAISYAEAGTPKTTIQKTAPAPAPDAGNPLLTVLGRREVILNNLPSLTTALGQKSFKPFFSQGSVSDAERDAVFIVFDGDKGPFGLFMLYSDGAWHVVKDDFL